MMGPSADLALLMGGVLCFLIALCFAEVSARFDATGGAYVYTREAFGDFVDSRRVDDLPRGHRLVGGARQWLHPGAVSLRPAGEGLTQNLVALSVIRANLVNTMGAHWGAAVVKFFTVAKLILTLFIAVGLFFIDPPTLSPSPHGTAPLADTLLLLYAYAGFETLVVPAGEMDNPRRNVPRALFILMAVVTVVYMGIFGVAVGIFDGIAGHANPVAAASAVFMALPERRSSPWASA